MKETDIQQGGIPSASRVFRVFPDGDDVCLAWSDSEDALFSADNARKLGQALIDAADAAK